MALFTINRYLGHEEEKELTSESQSKALLAKLQKQAKAREKQSLASKEELTVQDADTTQSNLGKSKRKPEEDEEEVEEKKQHKKKKKRKEKEEEESTELLKGPDVPAPVETEDTETDIFLKKKKKRDKKKAVANKEEQDTNDASEENTDAVQQTEGESQKTQETDSGHPDPSDTDPGKISSNTSFQILGGFMEKKEQKVQRVLPKWLSEPDVIEKDIKSNLVPLSDVAGICPALQKKLEAKGIQNFFPVQAEVIPAILETVNSGLLIGQGGYRPRDICVSAPTGSGKTLAFVIPIIQALSTRMVCEVRALAVLPTKELAEQVYKVFHSYAEGTGLKVVMAAGQKSFAREQAALTETRGGRCRSLADIVVATPGRLVDHINQNESFTLQHLRFLIIDEADRMMDSMDQAWLSQVIKAVYKSGSGSDTSIFRRVEPGPITVASLSVPQMPLQKLLFSATLTHNPEKLQQLGLHQPRLFSSTQNNSHSEEKFDFPQGLTEYYVVSTMNNKPLLILYFLLRLKYKPVLCFTNSREAAHRLYLLLKFYGGLEVAEFSSRLSPSERQKTLKSFENGKISMLISTDAAARGLDIKGVNCIINYDSPQYIRTYIHRVGRTARAGNAGVAFTFLFAVQLKKFQKMLLDAGSPGLQKHSVNPKHLKGLERRYEEILVKLGEAIKEEKAQNHF